MTRLTLPITVALFSLTMLDRALQTRLTPVLRKLAAAWVARGGSADQLTWLGFGLGVLAALSIAFQQPLLGLALILLSRLCDGLDGAVARLTQPSARGAFLDITLDFLFYALIPLAFAVADPAQNALAAAVLLACFMGTGSSFLAFAALAEKAGLKADVTLPKGLYFIGGLTEATETLLVFVGMCLWPAYFPVLAYSYAVLCVVTIGFRLWVGIRVLEPREDKF